MRLETSVTRPGSRLNNIRRSTAVSTSPRVPAAKVARWMAYKTRWRNREGKGEQTEKARLLPQPGWFICSEVGREHSWGADAPANESRWIVYQVSFKQPCAEKNPGAGPLVAECRKGPGMSNTGAFRNRSSCSEEDARTIRCLDCIADVGKEKGLRLCAPDAF